jgi:hypothetical protein
LVKSLLFLMPHVVFLLEPNFLFPFMLWMILQF